MPKQTSDKTQFGDPATEVTGARPSASPPSSVGTGQAADEAKPRDINSSEAFGILGASAAEPSLVPPQESSGIQGGITSTWQNDKRITALWSINQDRNSWVYVNGIGWKRLANNSASAIVALTTLSGNARQTQTAVNYREEADGMIYEMYVW